MSESLSVPSYLRAYASVYRRDPHQAALDWFRDAKFGLFLHYGLYSLLERGEWVMYNEAIPISRYERQARNFQAHNFSPDRITDLALEAGMKYVNLTARHHDSFCLFESEATDFTSVEVRSRRDLVGELAEACAEKGLGFFVYYSYALDWRHPYFYPRKYNEIARPDYDTQPDQYKFEKDEDFQHYIDFVHTQIRELLTNYGPLAGIWFDPVMGYYARPDLFPIEETYALVRELQPQALIAFKQGANGEEDFASPERDGHSLADRVRERFGEEAAEVAQHAWDKNRDKHNEICDTLQPKAWGYNKEVKGQHHSSDEVMGMLDNAWAQDCNLLLNTGPQPDGSILAEDTITLRLVGARLRSR